MIWFIAKYPRMRSDQKKSPPNQIRVFAKIIGCGTPNKSCSSGWVCLVNLYLREAYSNPKPAGSTPPNGGNSLNKLAGASKQKLLLGRVCIAKLYFGGLTFPSGPAGPTPPNRGISLEIWARASKQKLLLAVS
jgi:hypothetical protein